MYAYLNAAVKHALAKYNIAPSLDFTLNAEIQQLSAVQLPTTGQQKEETEKGYLYTAFTNKNQAHLAEQKDKVKQWKELYEIATQVPKNAVTNFNNADNFASQAPELHRRSEVQSNNILSVQGALLVTTVKSGLMLVHIRRAQERIWYERLLQEWNSGGTPSQQLLFPVQYEPTPQDAILLTEVLPDLVKIGFDVSPFGQHTFVVQGVPTALPQGEEKNVLDEVIDQLKHEAPDAVAKRADKLLTNMARRLSRNTDAMQRPEAQQSLIDELFACTQPEYTPAGKKIFTMVKRDDLDAMLG
jgi:DNA mismatch repair protein MutL